MEKDNDFASKYKPEYCEQLIRHLKGLKTFSCFNVSPPVTNKTLYNWLEEHPEFRHAREVGEKMAQDFLEGLAYYKATGIKAPALDQLGSKKIDGEMVRFLLSRRFRKDYSIRAEIEHSGSVSHTVIFEEVGGREECDMQNDGRPMALPPSSMGDRR